MIHGGHGGEVSPTTYPTPDQRRLGICVGGRPSQTGNRRTYRATTSHPLSGGGTRCQGSVRNGPAHADRVMHL